MLNVELKSTVDGAEMSATISYPNDFLPDDPMVFYGFLGDEMIKQLSGDLMKFSQFMENMKISNITKVSN